MTSCPLAPTINSTIGRSVSPMNDVTHLNVDFYILFVHLFNKWCKEGSYNDVSYNVENEKKYKKIKRYKYAYKKKEGG